MKIVSENTQRTTPDSIQTEAASWIAQIDSGKLSQTDRLALAEWVGRSARHRTEIYRLAHMWQGVDRAIDEALGVQGHARTKSRVSLWSILMSTFYIRPRMISSVIAASFLLVAAFVLFTQRQSLNPDQHMAEVQSSVVYAVPIGDDLVQTLEDGSIIHLNTDTLLEVNYSEQERRINLIRGEAYFDVQSDPLRPFRVYAAQGIAEAVGTQFQIRLDGPNLDLTVTEGKVRLETIALENAPSIKSKATFQIEAPVLVQAGEQAQVTSQTTRLAALDENTIERKIAWRKGQFIFSGDRLEDVIGQISRYSELKVVISDPTLRDLRVSGRFSTEEVKPIIQALGLSMNMDVAYINSNLIYLSKKEP